MLLSTSAFTALIVLSIACLFMSEEMRRLMPSDIFGSLDAYVTGAIVIAGFAALGWVLFRQAAAPETE